MADSIRDNVDSMLVSVRDMIDRLLHTKEEIALRARDKRMLTVFQKGKVTSADILEADFGTKTPNGLDIVNFPNFVDEFVPLDKHPYFQHLDKNDQVVELQTVKGMAGKNHRIYIHPNFYKNKLKFMGSLSNLIAHEHTHRLQGIERDMGWDSVLFNRRMPWIYSQDHDAGLKAKAKRLYQRFQQSSLDSRYLLLTDPVVGNGLWAQTKDVLRKSWKIATNSVTPLWQNPDSKMHDYFSEECEMQARLHEVMIQGYAVWQRMPTNKVELWAALHNTGFSTPKSITKQLKQTSEGKQALNNFRCSMRLKCEFLNTVKNMNRVFDYAVFSNRQEFLWENIYPYLYGNLLEHYGDGPGRERMGLGSNPKLAKEVLFALKTKNSDGLTPVILKNMVDQVPAQRAAELINAIILNDFPSHSEEVVDLLLARDDVKTELNNNTRHSFMDGLLSQSVLMNALCAGHAGIVKKLLMAGVDPLTSHYHKDIHGNELEVNILGFIGACGEQKAALSGDAAALKKLKKTYDKPDFMDKLTKIYDSNKKSLAALVESYKEIDDVREIGGRQVSLRRLLKEVNLTMADLDVVPMQKNKKKEEIAFSGKPAM